jgi:hypothetical protein
MAKLIPHDIDAYADPLGIDKLTIKEFNLRPENEPSPRFKLAFLQAQLEEIEGQCWRERVNIIHARRLQQSDNQNLASKGNANIIEHRNTVERLSEGLVMIKRLMEQLREEYPELQAEV